MQYVTAQRISGESWIRRGLRASLCFFLGDMNDAITVQIFVCMP